MTLPKVSIIIPNYNHAHFLDERINSVLNQTFQDFEVILLDDCSTDDSLKILDKYKSHPKVSHYKVNKHNSGSVFRQWVKGIKLSKGEYIWIAESDDVAHPEFLEETLNFILDKKDFGLVFTKSTIIDEKGNETGGEFKPHNKDSEFKISGPDLVSEYLVKSMVIANASSVLFKAESFKFIDFNKLIGFKNTGDRYSYIQIGLNSTIYFLDRSLNYYRSHNSNTTKKNILNKSIYKDRLRIVDDLIKHFSKNASASLNLKEFYVKHLFIFYKVNSLVVNQKVLGKLLKYSYLNFSIYLKFSFLNILSSVFKRHLPHRIRKYYKEMIKREFEIKI
ncbi:glycosyltransferase family 2 protein [Psychroflexus sp. CAK8W]|uniref:Glycosyltransferase family 2 protein n=1 Tax=Psychroflexus longus TaxID=2873596 RepID=A0ABS7XKD3_9FLAO|nr:glycosyltransferase [Psychroflexus longus]MBZ9779444.1 glycosyltransferase family 2 protein [Psychroflexus longus]